MAKPCITKEVRRQHSAVYEGDGRDRKRVTRASKWLQNKTLRAGSVRAGSVTFPLDVVQRYGLNLVRNVTVVQTPTG